MNAVALKLSDTLTITDYSRHITTGPPPRFLDESASLSVITHYKGGDCNLVLCYEGT